MAAYHLNATLSSASDDALLAANTTAIYKSNAASQRMKMGLYEESISLHREALTLKLQAYPESSVQVAVTYNGMGEAFLRAGRLDEDDEVLSKALEVRERDGTYMDAATTRENVGALREAQNRFQDARDVRLRGAEKGMVCSNEHCLKTIMVPRSQLSTCAACRAPFYCSKGCQKRDWNDRHKPLCKARTSAAASSQPAA
ncbi:hypothetical protein GGR58DRAFT_490551 [Xylaria digitata]|nr:hypothetical protein GGR58DRAFT_490551 [Xylaria digitata]